VTHLAPELFQIGSRITTSVDTFSFGIMMWELYTGQRAYSGLARWGTARGHVCTARGAVPVGRCCGGPLGRWVAVQCMAAGCSSRQQAARCSSQLRTAASPSSSAALLPAPTPAPHPPLHPRPHPTPPTAAGMPSSTACTRSRRGLPSPSVCPSCTRTWPRTAGTRSQAGGPASPRCSSACRWAQARQLLVLACFCALAWALHLQVDEC
jgi:hypothetical protein